MKDDIMKVELAIERELAYRQKVAMLHGDPGEDLLPLQVQYQDSSLTSSQNVECQSRIPAKESSLGSLQPQPPPQYSRHVFKNPSRGDNLFCKVCQVPCSSSFNYRQHTRGHKHRARVGELKLARNDGGEVANERVWCQLCNIWCMNQDSYDQHLDGQKHHKAEFAKKNEKLMMKTQKYCGLCLIWCPDDIAFKQHLQGKNHVFKLQTMERRRSGREEDGTSRHGP